MSVINSDLRLTDLPKHVRRPAVAGMFYPEDAAELRQMVAAFLDDAQVDVPAPKAIIAPHAGYIYSGPIAARAYASLAPVKEQITRIILLGPAHRVYLQGLALPDATAFTTPLGDIDLDLPLMNKLKSLPQVTVMDAAHDTEHSLEVHLPFLQLCLGKFSLVPLVVGDAAPEQVAEVLDMVWGGEETLIVISSDLSHYHDYETARRIDAQTSDAIQHLRLEDIGPQQACGCMPMRGLLHIARQRGMHVRILDCRNSGDTAGSRDQVVGYGAYSLDWEQQGLLSAKDRAMLLEIANKSIEEGFKTKQPLSLNPDEYEQHLRPPCATFVTLKLEDNLRGCMGTLQATSPLVCSIAESAFNAAFRDPRFKALTPEEFEDIELSISVLSPNTPIEFNSDEDLLAQLRPGIDGLIIEKGPHRATFLPAVWENLPQARDFLSQLKLKAGMDQDDVPDKAWRYESESF